MLPKNFEILPDDASLSDRVKLLKTWDDTELWYKKDDKFKRPKGIVNFKFYSNDCLFSQTSQGRLFAEVWRQCLDEYLREFTYMASCATLNFEIVVAPDNVELTWSGFNDSLPVFVVETINRIKAMKTADIKDIFEQKKEAMLQEYKNFYLNQTFRLAWGQVAYHLQGVDHERKVLRELLQKTDYAAFKSSFEQWFTSGRMIWGFFGNISVASAIETATLAREVLNINPTKRENLLDFRIVSLPHGE